MAKIAPAFFDNSGQHHPCPEAAVTADIATALGRLNGDSGISPGIAKLILEKRREIEQAFADLDSMKAAGHA